MYKKYSKLREAVIDSIKYYGDIKND